MTTATTQTNNSSKHDAHWDCLFVLIWPSWRTALRTRTFTSDHRAFYKVSIASGSIGSEGPTAHRSTMLDSIAHFDRRHYLVQRRQSHSMMSRTQGHCVYIYGSGIDGHVEVAAVAPMLRLRAFRTKRFDQPGAVGLNRRKKVEQIK